MMRSIASTVIARTWSASTVSLRRPSPPRVSSLLRSGEFDTAMSSTMMDVSVASSAAEELLIASSSSLAYPYAISAQSSPDAHASRGPRARSRRSSKVPRASPEPPSPTRARTTCRKSLQNCDPRPRDETYQQRYPTLDSGKPTPPTMNTASTRHECVACIVNDAASSMSALAAPGYTHLVNTRYAALSIPGENGYASRDQPASDESSSSSSSSSPSPAILLRPPPRGRLLVLITPTLVLDTTPAVPPKRVAISNMPWHHMATSANPSTTPNPPAGEPKPHSSCERNVTNTPGDTNHSARSDLSSALAPLPSRRAIPASAAKLPSPMVTSRSMRRRGQLATPKICAVRCTGATERHRDRLAIAPGNTYPESESFDDWSMDGGLTPESPASSFVSSFGPSPSSRPIHTFAAASSPRTAACASVSRSLPAAARSARLCILLVTPRSARRSASSAVSSKSAFMPRRHMRSR